MIDSRRTDAKRNTHKKKQTPEPTTAAANRSSGAAETRPRDAVEPKSPAERLGRATTAPRGLTRASDRCQSRRTRAALSTHFCRPCGKCARPPAFHSPVDAGSSRPLLISPVGHPSKKTNNQLLLRPNIASYTPSPSPTNPTSSHCSSAPTYEIDPLWQASACYRLSAFDIRLRQIRLQAYRFSYASRWYDDNTTATAQCPQPHDRISRKIGNGSS